MKRLPWAGDAPPPVAERPRCRYCNRPLKPMTMTTFVYRPDVHQIAKQFTGKYGGYGDNVFCGLRCGYRFGRRVAHNV